MDELIDLLPLYAELQGHPKLEIVKHYARACVVHATAAKDAEIEALRAEVDEWKRVAAAQAELHDEAEARADKLEEALRGWWEARRPVSWTEDQHRSCPHVNLATDAEEALATALLRELEEGK